MISLETQRLRLRPLMLDDLDFLTRVHADPEVARFIGHGTPRSGQETRSWLQRTLGWYREEGIGHLGVECKADGKLVGRCGLNCFEIERGVEQPRGFWGRGSAPEGVEVTPQVELGYTFAREAWGQGYATEAARCIRDHAFGHRGEKQIISLVHPDNQRSIRVAMKLGMQKQNMVEVFGASVWRFVMDRERYWQDV
jgi:ribosomal-protein-alanine N-acetyltransferase